MIETTPSGVVVATGKGIEVFRLLSLLQALKLQALGVRMSRAVPQATTIARKQYGLKGNLESLTGQVQKLLNEARNATAYVQTLPGA